MAAIERLEQEKKEYQGEIEVLRQKNDEIQAVQERHKQRQQVAEARLAYLAAQKAKESLPTPYIQRVQAAAKIVAASEDPVLQPLKELLAVLEGQEGAEQFNIGTEGSSSDPGEDGSEDSNSTQEQMGRTGGEEDEGYDAFEDEARAEIACARARLAATQKLYNSALESALEATKLRATKRRSGEDGPKQAHFHA